MGACPVSPGVAPDGPGGREFGCAIPGCAVPCSAMPGTWLTGATLPMTWLTAGLKAAPLTEDPLTGGGLPGGTLNGGALTWVTGWVLSAAMMPASGSGQKEPSDPDMAGPRAAIMGASWARLIRSAGFLTMQAVMACRRLPGTPLRSGSPVTTRYRMEAALPPPNGALPVAA